MSHLLSGPVRARSLVDEVTERLEAAIMRVVDVQLSFPSILIALLFAGVGHALFPNANDLLAFGVVIVPLGRISSSCVE